MSHQAASWWIFNQGEGEFQLQIDQESRSPILIGQSGTYELEVETVWIKGYWALYGSRGFFFSPHQVQVNIRHPLIVIEQGMQVLWGQLAACTHSYKYEKRSWISGQCQHTVSEMLCMSLANPKASGTFFSSQACTSWLGWTRPSCSIAAVAGIWPLRPWIVLSEIQSDACYVRDHSAHEWCRSLMPSHESLVCGTGKLTCAAINNSSVMGCRWWLFGKVWLRSKGFNDCNWN